MEKYCPECRKVFEEEDYLLCPYCGSSLKSREGRQPIPRELRHKVFQRDGYRCRECGATNKETTLEIDHIIPVAKGGTNDINNLQTLCKECNRAKLTDEWIGGENSLDSLKIELRNLENLQLKLKNKLNSFNLSEEEIIDYKFKLKINKERIIELNNLIEEKEKDIIERNKLIEMKNKERKEKELLYKKLYLEDEDEFINYLFIKYDVPQHITTKQEKIKYVVKKIPSNFNLKNEKRIFKEKFELIHYLKINYDSYLIKIGLKYILTDKIKTKEELDNLEKIDLIDYLKERTEDPHIIEIIEEKINNGTIKYKGRIKTEIKKYYE